MSNAKVDNSYNPAYPFHIKLRNKDGEEPFQESVSYGLTKREYFAVLAMQGLLAEPRLTIEASTSLAVELADILLKKLEKTK